MSQSTDDRPLPTDDRIQRLSQSVDQVWQLNHTLSQSLKPLRWIGFGLLLLSLIAWVEILIPPNFMNPSWELETFGAIVEQAVWPLLGLGLVFLGGEEARSINGRRGAALLSWISLLLGILFFLLIPLGLANTARLDRLSAAQLNEQVQEKTVVIQQIRDQLSQTNSPDELETLIATLSNGQTPEISSDQEVSQLKEKLSASIDQGESNLKSQVQTTRSNQRLLLVKKSVKWNLGALILGTLFILLWRSTTWVRQTKL